MKTRKNQAKIEIDTKKLLEDWYISNREIKRRKKGLSDFLESKSNKFPDDQRIILANAIMDDNLLGYIFTKYKNKQIKIKHFSKYAQFILRWIIHYYGKYERAPRQHIEDIFNGNQAALGKDLSDSIELTLNDLNEFNNNNDEINIDYIREEVIPRFVKRKEAKRLINEIQNKIDSDDLEKLDKAIESYTEITEDEDILPKSYTPGQIANEFPINNKWLIPHILPKCGHVLVSGSKGTFKTTSMIKFSDVILKQNKKYKVAFVLNEHQSETIKNLNEYFDQKSKDRGSRINILARTHQKFFNTDGVTVNRPIYSFNDLDKSSGLDRLAQCLEEQEQDGSKIVLVVFDSLSKIFGGKLNDTNIGLLLNSISDIVCGRFRACMVMIHHYGKDANRRGVDRVLYSSQIVNEFVHCIGFEKEDNNGVACSSLIKIDATNIDIDDTRPFARITMHGGPISIKLESIDRNAYNKSNFTKKIKIQEVKEILMEILKDAIGKNNGVCATLIFEKIKNLVSFESSNDSIRILCVRARKEIGHDIIKQYWKGRTSYWYRPFTIRRRNK